MTFRGVFACVWGYQRELEPRRRGRNPPHLLVGPWLSERRGGWCCFNSKLREYRILFFKGFVESTSVVVVVVVVVVLLLCCVVLCWAGVP